MKRLQNKSTLITGGTTGIGYETAKQFLAEGAKVFITGQNADRLNEAVTSLGNGAEGIISNAGDVAEQKALVAQLQKHDVKLDAVFLNAGIGIFKPIESISPEEFDRQMDINLKGPYFLLQTLLPLLNQPASIVLNTSINAHIGMPNSSIYAASKAGFLSYARTLSGELAGKGIRINAISPGPVSTPIYGKLGIPQDQLAQTAEAIRSQIPLGRFGETVEIAKAAVFLASDESSFMLGSEIIIDGGMSTL